MQPLASIPSPPYGVVHVGPVPLRAYALMIILGVIVAVWIGERRWATRGGSPGVIVDIAVWAVPFGLVGARLYHVITDHQRYFGAGQHPIDAFKIWTGGLGIWGAVALGTLGAYIGCRRRGISLRVLADAVAPGIAVAQAIGRWGNWFNQELYGRPLHTFWAVSIDRDHRPQLLDGTLDPRYADIATYHPTFLYESLWCVGVAVLVIWADKRFRLTYGRTFALYVAAYTVGRAWIESLRIDPAHHFLGLRLNDWTALVVFLAAVAYLYLCRDRGEVPASAYGTATPATVDAPGAAAPDQEAAAEPEKPAESDTVTEPAEPAGAETVTEIEEPPETVAEPEEPAGAEAEESAGSDTVTESDEPDEAEAVSEPEETDEADAVQEPTESAGVHAATESEEPAGADAVSESEAVESEEPDGADAVSESEAVESEEPIGADAVSEPEEPGTAQAEAEDTGAEEAEDGASGETHAAPEPNGSRTEETEDARDEAAAGGERTSPRSG